MDKKEFWSTKNPGPQYEAVVFTNSAFAAPIRLVSNVFEAVSLGGHVHQPVPMTIKPPDKTSTTAKLTLAFPRNVVGREFKRQLACCAPPARGSRSPCSTPSTLTIWPPRKWLGNCSWRRMAVWRSTRRPCR